MKLKERTYTLTNRGLSQLLGLLEGIVAAPLQACLNLILPRLVDVLADVVLHPALKLLTGALRNVPLVGGSLVLAVDYLFERVSELFPVNLGRDYIPEEEAELGEGSL